MKKENIALFFALVMTTVALTGCRMIDRTTASVDRKSLDTNRRYTASQLMNLDPPDNINPRTNQLKRGVTPAVTARNNVISNSAIPDYRAGNVTVDHISSILGLTETDLNAVFPPSSRLAGSYLYNIYGKETDFKVDYDNNNKVNKITVTTDRATAARWQRELDARYGTQTISGQPTNSWIKNRLRVDLDNAGDDVRIVFTNVL